MHGWKSTAGVLWHYAVYVLCKYAARKKTVKRRIYDYEMYLSLTTQGISKSLFLYGHREDDHREIFLRELHEGYKVLDIGSNIGYYALMEARLVGNQGKVIAVEPDKRNLELLNENILLNKLFSDMYIINILVLFFIKFHGKLPDF